MCPAKLKTIIVNDKMQKGYRYLLAAPMGRDFDLEFAPELTPKEMLRLGVFGGKYTPLTPGSENSWAR